MLNNMKVDLYSGTGTKLTAKAELPGEIFGIEPNEAALRQYLHVYQANQRLGTVKTKTRGEVSGGGRKPWRQKGTGRARQGSIRSPIWVKGGVAHGPKPRDFSLSISKKVSRLALRSALSFKAGEERIKVLQGLEFEKPKTSAAAALLKKLGFEKRAGRVLVVLPEANLNTYCSFRNIEKVEVRTARELNAYDTALAGDLVILRDSITKLKERLAVRESKQPRTAVGVQKVELPSKPASGKRSAEKKPVGGKKVAKVSPAAKEKKTAKVSPVAKAKKATKTSSKGKAGRAR